MLNPDQAPQPHAMDSLDLEFFLQDLDNFSHIKIPIPNSTVHFSVHYGDSDCEIVYKLSA